MIKQSHSWTCIQRKSYFKKIHAPQYSTEALFTVAKIWKYCKCPLTKEYTKKMLCMHTMEYYSAIKKNKNTFCRNIYKPRDYCTK